MLTNKTRINAANNETNSISITSAIKISTKSNSGTHTKTVVMRTIS